MSSYLGVDCGLDGAIVAIKGDKIIAMLPMPTYKESRKRSIDIETLSDLLNSQYKRDCCTAIIEDPGGHAPSAAGLRSMTYSFAIIKALLVAHKIQFKCVRAITWQRQFWDKPKGMKGRFDTKLAALNAAKNLWPTQDWRRTARSKKPFDGFVDAALIAEYGRRLYG